jgi:hypothetical protein
VQTFLPFPDFERSARVLDQRRLGRQRVEALQLLNAITVPGHGYRHHPAAKMWRGHEEALVRYALTMCEVWGELGFNDTVAGTVTGHLEDRLGITRVRTQRQLQRARELPAWFGDEAFHRAHRSNLLRKDPEHYGPLFDDVPDDLEYVWPVRGGADRG